MAATPTGWAMVLVPQTPGYYAHRTLRDEHRGARRTTACDTQTDAPDGPGRYRLGRSPTPCTRGSDTRGLARVVWHARV